MQTHWPPPQTRVSHAGGGAISGSVEHGARSGSPQERAGTALPGSGRDLGARPLLSAGSERRIRCLGAEAHFDSITYACAYALRVRAWAEHALRADAARLRLQPAQARARGAAAAVRDSRADGAAPAARARAGLRPWMQLRRVLARSTSELDPRARLGRHTRLTLQKRSAARRTARATSVAPTLPRSGGGARARPARPRAHRSRLADELAHGGFMLGHIERQHARADEPASRGGRARGGHGATTRPSTRRPRARAREAARSAVTGFATAGGGGPPSMLERRGGAAARRRRSLARRVLGARDDAARAGPLLRRSASMRRPRQDEHRLPVPPPRLDARDGAAGQGPERPVLALAQRGAARASASARVPSPRLALSLTPRPDMAAASAGGSRPRKDGPSSTSTRARAAQGSDFRATRSSAGRGDDGHQGAGAARLYTIVDAERRQRGRRAGRGSARASRGSRAFRSSIRAARRVRRGSRG